LRGDIPEAQAVIIRNESGDHPYQVSRDVLVQAFYFTENKQQIDFDEAPLEHKKTTTTTLTRG
jgi:hypothetical protein